MSAKQRPAFFAAANFRRSGRLIGIAAEDRLSHIYALGKTGVGKSTLLETFTAQDIQNGRGFALIDPHGDLAERALVHARNSGRDDILYIDPAADQPFGYNPLRRVRPDMAPLAVAGVLETFRKLWPDAWGMRMEHVLRNCLFALIEREGSSLPDILTLFSDKDYRAAIVKEITNPVVKAFWEDEFELYPARLRAEALAPIQNKLGALLTDPRVYRFLVDPQRDLRFRKIMDGEGGLILNLAKGRIGEDAARVIGGLTVSTLGLAALSRSAAPAPLPPFYVHVDEFQSFTTLSFVNMMAELRKYGLGLTLANQHLHQLGDDIRHAVLGNAGTLIAFRVGPDDAAVLAREFQPVFNIEDLLNLPNGRIYLKLMIDGAPSRPFSAGTLTPHAAVLRVC